jgi:putative sigma-54 modulation protein
MDIKFSSVHFSADKKLTQFITEKVNKLGHFFEGIIGAEVTMKLENTQELENKMVEIRLLVPGYDLFAKKQSKSFEEAADDVVDALRKQVLKHKEKMKGI